MAESEPKPKDRRDTLDMFIKLIGAIGIPVVLAGIGIGGSIFLAHRQEAETNLRLYTELMSKREEADTSLRKEMFNSIITNFLKPASEEQPDKMVLNLELLAYNFHDSLDLAPLFKDVNKKLLRHPDANKPYIDRLTKVTRDVIAKQIAMLEEAGGSLDGSLDLAEIDRKPAGVMVIDELIPAASIEHPRDPSTQKQVRVEVLSVDRSKRELEVRLIVRTSPDTVAESVFTVGFFDFPMLDNVRLPQGLRCAIVLNQFDAEQGMADLTLVYFPGDRAGLKEKPYYDEILSTLRKPSAP
jgi:hypothetical protein